MFTWYEDSSKLDWTKLWNWKKYFFFSLHSYYIRLLFIMKSRMIKLSLIRYSRYVKLSAVCLAFCPALVAGFRYCTKNKRQDWLTNIVKSSHEKKQQKKCHTCKTAHKCTQTTEHRYQDDIKDKWPALQSVILNLLLIMSLVDLQKWTYRRSNPDRKGNMK